MSSSVCPNCNNEFTAHFCNNCGQKVVHRITMSHLWHDLIHAFTHADKGFLYLLVQLFKKPGIVAREYIVEGKRKRYFTPLQYFIIISAIATFVVVNTHYFEHTLESLGAMETTKNVYSAKQQEFMQKVTLWQSKYYNIMIMLQLPFYALSTLFLYKKKKFNYAELLTLQTLVTAQVTIISTLLILVVTVIKSNPFVISSIMMVLMLAYQAIAYMQFFQEKTWKGFFRAVFSYILGVIFFMIFAIAIGVIIGLVIVVATKLIY